MLIHMEHPMHKRESIVTVKRCGRYAETLEVIEYIRFDAFKSRLCGLYVVGFYAECEVFGFDKTVVTLGKLTSKHFCVLGAYTVKVIVLRWYCDAVGVGVFVRSKIHKGKLKMHRAVEVVEKVAPSVEDGCLILVLIKLIIDVLKLYRLGKISLLYAADTVLPHPLKGYAVLG